MKAGVGQPVAIGAAQKFFGLTEDGVYEAVAAGTGLPVGREDFFPTTVQPTAAVAHDDLDAELCDGQSSRAVVRT